VRRRRAEREEPLVTLGQRTALQDALPYHHARLPLPTLSLHVREESLSHNADSAWQRVLAQAARHCRRLLGAVRELFVQRSARSRRSAALDERLRHLRAHHRRLAQPHVLCERGAGGGVRVGSAADFEGRDARSTAALQQGSIGFAHAARPEGPGPGHLSGNGSCFASATSRSGRRRSGAKAT
jgi:hypothetical protein